MMMVVMMTRLSGRAAGGGGSCGFEKDGLVPVTSAAATAAPTAITPFLDGFDFTYFDAQIGQPIVTVGAASAATPADVDRPQLSPRHLPKSFRKHFIKRSSQHRKIKNVDEIYDGAAS